MGTYKTAEVCPNGHVSTSSIDENPELREKYCSKCGEQTITQCPNCNEHIRGYFKVSSYYSKRSNYKLPAYCHGCGDGFPWTERKISGAIALIKEGGDLSTDELELFEKDLIILTKDSPDIQAASLRFKEVMKRLGGSLASGVKEVVISVISEVAKKAIWS